MITCPCLVKDCFWKIAFWGGGGIVLYFFVINGTVTCDMWTFNQTENVISCSYKVKPVNQNTSEQNAVRV